MEETDTYEAVKGFIEEKLLKGQEEVDSDTPLLEWGILDSLSVARLGGFIERHFDVVMPGGSATREKFHTLDTICEFIAELRTRKADAEPSAERTS